MDNVPHNTEAEQLAHSGDLGLEKPEREFDNTTLPEAFDKHLTDTDGNVIVPDNASAVAVEKESSTETQKKRGKIWAIGAAAVAAITGVSLAIGLNLPKGDHDNTAPTPDDKATSQPSEAPSASPEAPAGYPEKAYSAETLRLPENLSAEEAAKLLFEDRLNQSDNAGKSDAFKSGFEKASHDSVNGEVAYAKDVAAKNSSVLTDTLFIPDWKSNPNLVNSAHDLELSNYATISLWAWTYHPDPADKPAYPEDKTPYERSQTVDNVEVVSKTETSASLNVTFTMHDNRSENGAAKLTDQPDPNGQKMLAAVELQKVNGSWKVSNLTFRSL